MGRIDARFPVFIAALLAAPAVLADELPLVQVAAHAGYRVGGSLEDADTGDNHDLDDGTSFALALELRYGKRDDRYLQLWYSRQGSSVDDNGSSRDVDVEYLHLGGTVPFGDSDKAQGYLALGIGATRFSPSAVGASDLTRFSGSLGLGVAMPLSRHAAFRLEARGYLTVVDSDSAIFCRSDNGTGFCRIIASGSTIFQAEVLAGFAVSF
jgi:hypothetical protein